MSPGARTSEGTGRISLPPAAAGLYNSAIQQEGGR